MSPQQWSQEASQTNGTATSTATVTATVTATPTYHERKALWISVLVLGLIVGLMLLVAVDCLIKNCKRRKKADAEAAARASAFVDKDGDTQMRQSIPLGEHGSEPVYLLRSELADQAEVREMAGTCSPILVSSDVGLRR